MDFQSENLMRKYLGLPPLAGGEEVSASFDGADAACTCACDAAPKKPQTLEQHLKQYHHGQMPKGDCSWLKQYKKDHPDWQKDAAKVSKGESSVDTVKKDAAPKGKKLIEKLKEGYRRGAKKTGYARGETVSTPEHPFFDPKAKKKEEEDSRAGSVAAAKKDDKKSSAAEYLDAAKKDASGAKKDFDAEDMTVGDVIEALKENPMFKTTSPKKGEMSVRIADDHKKFLKGKTGGWDVLNQMKKSWGSDAVEKLGTPSVFDDHIVFDGINFETGKKMSKGDKLIAKLKAGYRRGGEKKDSASEYLDAVKNDKGAKKSSVGKKENLDDKGRYIPTQEEIDAACQAMSDSFDFSKEGVAKMVKDLIAGNRVWQGKDGGLLDIVQAMKGKGGVVRAIKERAKEQFIRDDHPWFKEDFWKGK